MASVGHSEAASGVAAPSYSKTQSPLSPHERSTSVKIVGGNVGGATSPRDAQSSSAPADPVAEDDAAIATTPTLEDGAPPAIDVAAEEAFLGEARARGEVAQPKSVADADEDVTPKTLPPLDELVKKIPTDVRDVLEDLFRARFVAVKRFPKKSLK